MPRNYPGPVTSNESWRKYLEAGAAVGQATAARAEDIARRLFEGDDAAREDAWRDLEQLTRFGRLMGEQLAEMARIELGRQLRTVGGHSLDQFFDRITDLLGTRAPASQPSAGEQRESVLEASVVVVAEEPPVAPAEGTRSKQKKQKSKNKKHKAKSHADAKKHKRADAQRGHKNDKAAAKANKTERGAPRTNAEATRVHVLVPPAGSAEDS